MAGVNELQTYDYWKAKNDASPTAYYQTMMNKYKPATPTNSYTGGAVNVGVGANANSYIGPGLNLQSKSTTNGQGTTQGNTGTQDGTQDNVDPNKKPLTQKDIDDALKAGYDKATGEFKTEAEKIKEARIQNTINQLNSRFGQVQSDIAAQRSQIDPTYQAKRLNAQSGSALQAKNFAEFLANRGLSRSGTSQQAELMRNMSLQQALGQLDAQRKADEDYLTKQETDAKRALNSDINQARNDAEIAYMDNFLKYKTDMDLAYRQEKLKKEEMDYNKKAKEIEAIQKAYEADEKKKAEAEAATVKQEYDTYGFNLNPQQRQSLNAFNQAMQDPQFAQAYYQAYNSDGGIQSLINQAKSEGRDDLIEALEGGRFSKVLNEGMTDYAGQYSLPQKFYQNAYDTQTKGAAATTAMIKSQFAYELESLGLQKAANDVKNGNIKNAADEINLSWLPEEKKAEYANKLADLEQKQTQTSYIPYNAETSRMNAETSRMNANTNAFQAQDASQRGWASLTMKQKEMLENPSETFKEISKRLNNIFIDSAHIDKLNPGRPHAEGGTASFRTPGRTEHQTIIDTIRNAGLSDKEQLLLYNLYQIPLPVKKG